MADHAGRQREPAGAGLDRHHGNHVAALSPRAGREAIAYGHWFDQDAERREGRRGRLAEAQPFVPPLLWLVLGLGAGLVVGYMLMFADPREHFAVQAMMTGAVTAIVVSGLLIVGFLDTPYDDRSGSIRPHGDGAHAQAHRTDTGTVIGGAADPMRCDGPHNLTRRASVSPNVGDDLAVAEVRGTEGRELDALGACLESTGRCHACQMGFELVETLRPAVLVAVTALLADERGRHSVVTPPRPRAEARDRARPDRLLTSAKLR